MLTIWWCPCVESSLVLLEEGICYDQCILFGEGNGNPLQCSCLENPRDSRALWAAVYGVAQSWTRLKWLSSAFSWQNSISLCPASFRIPRPNLPVTPDVSWLATFAFQSPILKRTSFLGVRSIYTYKYFILEVFPPYLSHLFTRLYLCAWSEVESNFIFSIKIIY